mmetsp:Transcript_2423/g.9130  ORF Transcript_2423/g.9130 Transcript_2423/m.9130 type:complete len:88 (+) Transcript_2423:444-707(+)
MIYSCVCGSVGEKREKRGVPSCFAALAVYISAAFPIHCHMRILSTTPLLFFKWLSGDCPLPRKNQLTKSLNKPHLTPLTPPKLTTLH